MEAVAWTWRSPEREPQDHLPEESRDIIGPVDSAKRRVLVREQPPAEEPAESAAKKRQCVPPTEGTQAAPQERHPREAIA